MDITIKINNYKSATASKARSPHIALVAAAGKGTRMRTEVPKQLLCYKGKAVVERTASVFAAHEEIDAVFLLIPQDKEYDETFFQIADRLEHLYNKPVRCSYGGNSRGESVYHGLEAISDYLSKSCEIDNSDSLDACEAVILIHDAARAEITEEIIGRNIAAMREN